MLNVFNVKLPLNDNITLRLHSFTFDPKSDRKESPMNINKKVYFTLSIGYSGANHEDEFTLEELGYDPKVDKDLEAFLEKEWKEWSANFIDGGWSFNKED
jgi:hypothetical protein